MAVKQLEPFFVSVFVAHARRRERVSETLHLLLNPPQVTHMLGERAAGVAEELLCRRLLFPLDELSPDYRRVLRGVLVEKLPLAEVASRMRRTPNAISLILLRASRKLRESFGDTQSLGLPDAELDWGGPDAED